MFVLNVREYCVGVLVIAYILSGYPWKSTDRIFYSPESFRKSRAILLHQTFGLEPPAAGTRTKRKSDLRNLLTTFSLKQV